MTLIRDLEHFPQSAKGGAVSVGNFDGVHLGHAQLISRLKKLADQLGGPAVAITFDPHPAAFLRASNVPERLTTMERRAELLKRCGADYVVVCRTSQQWLQQTAQEFFQQTLVARAAARGIIEGPNFFFGKDREGDTALLKQFCDQHAITLEIAEPTELESGAMVSSTQVRRLLAAGDVESANRLLTARYRLRGVVVHGDGRGKTIGFPTANLEDIQTVIPAPGVYATIAEVDGKRVASASHIGPNPTFDSTQKHKVEIHLMSFEADLYGREIDVEFHARIRDVVRFQSVEELIQQLKQDVAAARSLILPD